MSRTVHSAKRKRYKTDSTTKEHWYRAARKGTSQCSCNSNPTGPDRNLMRRGLISWRLLRSSFFFTSTQFFLPMRKTTSSSELTLPVQPIVAHPGLVPTKSTARHAHAYKCSSGNWVGYELRTALRCTAMRSLYCDCIASPTSAVPASLAGCWYPIPKGATVSSPAVAIETLCDGSPDKTNVETEGGWGWGGGILDVFSSLSPTKRMLMTTCNPSTPVLGEP